MVHGATLPDGTNLTAVVAVLYKFGAPDTFLSKVYIYIYIPIN